MADIPGLIKGASDGKGLGSQFLRHIERTKVLVYLVDSNSESILDDFKTLQKELKKYNSKLISRPSLLLITKIDLLLNSKINFDKNFNDISIIPLSSINGNNINLAIKSIAELIRSQSIDIN